MKGARHLLHCLCKQTNNNNNNNNKKTAADKSRSRCLGSQLAHCTFIIANCGCGWR